MPEELLEIREADGAFERIEVWLISHGFFAADSGEGRWTVEAAIDHAVPLPAITASLFARFASRQDDSPAMKAVSALRNQFGGHAVKNAAGEAEAGSGT